MSVPLLWPTYDFRPADLRFGFGIGPLLRFADGAWIEDDGEYDLAFIHGNTCLSVNLPYQRNIVWSGLTGHWTGGDRDHPRGGNPWHYMLRPGETEWGGPWTRAQHPNTKAGESGMRRAIRDTSCANGRHVEFKDDDKVIAAGLLRERETKAVVQPPERLVCCYCGDAWTAKRAAWVADGALA